VKTDLVTGIPGGDVLNRWRVTRVIGGFLPLGSGVAADYATLRLAIDCIARMSSPDRWCVVDRTTGKIVYIVQSRLWDHN